MRYAEVKEAVREFMAGRDTGIYTSYVQIPLAAKFEIDIQPHNWSGYRQSEGDKFLGQVDRALNQLADEGVLVKQIRTPVGRRKQAYWMNQAVASAEREAKAARDAVYAGHQVLVSRLSAQGYSPRITRDGVIISWDDAARLADLTAAGI